MIWNRPDAELPQMYAGDRLLIVVVERLRSCSPLAPRFVLIEATEDGWRCDDDTYNGYGPADGVCWALEKELLKSAAEVYALPSAPAEQGGEELLPTRDQINRGMFANPEDHA